MKVLRRSDVVRKVGYSSMHISRLEKARKLPQRIQLGPNSVGWFEHEIDAWLKAKADARDAVGA